MEAWCNVGGKGIHILYSVHKDLTKKILPVFNQIQAEMDLFANKRTQWKLITSQDPNLTKPNFSSPSPLHNTHTIHHTPQSVTELHFQTAYSWSVCYSWMLFLGIFHLQAFCCLWSLSRWKEWAEQDLSMVLNYFQLNGCPQATATRNMHQQYETVLSVLQQHCSDTENWRWPNSL